jgi:hypothetical protein
MPRKDPAVHSHEALRHSTICATANRDITFLRQISGRISAQRHEIDGLPPFRRLIGAASGNHLADDARQQIGGVLPSDQFETLEALVDEIK